MRTFPKSRIDALTDGIFAFAMTLLIIEVRLPPELSIRNSAELIGQLRSLWPEYLAYMISFFVLAALWRADAELRRLEQVSEGIVRLSIFYLFFITSVPFSTSLVGHYGDLPPAVWLYAANLIAVASLSLRLRASEIVVPAQQLLARAGKTRMLFLITTAIGSVLISLIAPRYSMYAYMLNIVAGPLTKRMHERKP